MVAILLALVSSSGVRMEPVAVRRGSLKCTGTFWAVSTGCLTFDPKCTGTFWAVLTSTGLQLTCFTFDTKCTGTFWAVSPGCLTFDTKCTGTFWALDGALANVSCF
jgi:hypothetical protein